MSYDEGFRGLARWEAKEDELYREEEEAERYNHEMELAAMLARYESYRAPTPHEQHAASRERSERFRARLEEIEDDILLAIGGD